MSKRIVLSIVLAFIAASVATIFALFQREIENPVFTRGSIGSLSLVGKTEKEIYADLQGQAALWMQEPFSFSYKGNGAMVSKPSVEVRIDIDGSFARAAARKKSVAGFIKSLVSPDEEILFSYNFSKIAQNVKDGLGLREAKSAYLAQEGKRVVVQPEVIGFSLQQEALKIEVEKNIMKLSMSPIEVETSQQNPEITKLDIEKLWPLFEKKIYRPMIFSHADTKITWYPKNNLDWIYFEKMKNITWGKDGPQEQESVALHIRPEQSKNFIRENFAKNYEYKPEKVKISQDEKGKVVFEGEGKEGSQIEYNEIPKLVEAALIDETASPTIEVPVRKIPNEIEISENLQKQGIKDLLTTGYTTYYGSPVNRMYNIKNGVSKFQGILIPQGATFSFNKILGKVDGSTGYRKELVIKPEGTIPEYGGGICQVSTTMYRAALYAGLPIVERNPHSYLVMYYAQVGGHGLDSTIYPGASDLKFINDTPAPILVQAYARDAEAYFKFYGTSDGRTVTLEGPKILSRSSEGGVEKIKTTHLPPGVEKLVEKAHPGMQTLWTRIIRFAANPDGTPGKEMKEEIKSIYKATGTRILVGATQEELKGDEKPVGQYFPD